MRGRWGGALIAAALVACGSSSSGGGGGGASNEQAASDIAQAKCVQSAKCSTYSFQTRYGDNATCLADEKLFYANALSAPNTARKAQDVESCASEYPSWACSDWLANKGAPAACGSSSGPLAAGGPCVFDSQCASAYCSVPDGFGCGRCATPQNAGDPCSTAQRCATGLSCASKTMTCVALGQQGDSCDTDAPCISGVSCVGITPTSHGTCQQAVGTLGAACDPKAQTGPGCDGSKGLQCSNASKTCVQATYAAPGQPCGSVNGVFTYCAAQGFCTTPAGQSQGTCTAASGEGGPCDTVNGPNCMFESRCVVSSGTAGQCHMPAASLCP
jgi:hypothetical protein